MDELNAAPSSTEPTAEELASIAMVTNAQEAGAAATGESVAAAEEASPMASVADAAASVPVASSPLPIAGASQPDAPAVAAVGEPSPSTSLDSQSSSGDDPNAGASAAADLALADTASALPASIGGTSSPSAANSLDSLPSRIAVHLESIYEMVVDHVRQLIGPVDVAKSELALEIDDLLHKLSNGIAVSDGRIVAKLAALRAML
ncbi:hypothetical protein QZM82_13410 [Burkholderia cepacia]|uniref:hypothetical protein n=1 Tax=Burkholderia cepacia TaxID=292 RepID=UPI002655D542|nr:hypothetical protein [Burkholderia cepacia]MDN7897189.1 hypothetical protein [Burkholderia cepacia]